MHHEMFPSLKELFEIPINLWYGLGDINMNQILRSEFILSFEKKGPSLIRSRPQECHNIS